jgi:hypothetical protein
LFRPETVTVVIRHTRTPRPKGADVYDWKCGARGISADVLHQSDAARSPIADEDETFPVALVIVDAGAFLPGSVRNTDRALRAHPARHA